MGCYSAAQTLGRHLTALLCIGATLLYGSLTPVVAQEEAPVRAPSIGIFHVSEYSGQEMPPPGAPLTLRAQLFNTNDVSIQLRTFANIDGSLIELTPSKVYLNRDDYPEYVIEAHAPQVTFSYFFVAYAPTGDVVRSEEYTLQRPCVPSIEPVSVEIEADANNGQERLREYVHKNWAIEKELEAYEHAKTLIDAIQKELDRLDGKK
jgi:hypothetical protein